MPLLLFDDGEYYSYLSIRPLIRLAGALLLLVSAASIEVWEARGSSVWRAQVGGVDWTP